MTSTYNERYTKDAASGGLSKGAMSRSDREALRHRVFKTVLETSLLACGAHKVTFRGLQDLSKVTSIDHLIQGLDNVIEIEALWSEADGSTRKANYRVSAGAFDRYMKTVDIGSTKYYAHDIAKQLALERIKDVLSRAMLTIPLSELGGE